MNPPSVSVITSVYNGSAYLAETIRSVLAQTEQDFEHILVDDGSSDDSVQLVNSFRDPRIRLHLNPRNIGIVGARNVAFSLARAPLVAILDQDDVCLPQRLEMQRAALQKDARLGLVASRSAVIDADSKEQPLQRGRFFSLDRKGWQALLMLRNPFVNSTVMVRREALDVPPYDPAYSLCEDYNMVRKIAVHWDLRMLDQVLLRYRVHGNNTSVRQNDELMRHLAQLRSEMISSLGLQLSEGSRRLLQNFEMEYASQHASPAQFIELLSSVLTQLMGREALGGPLARDLWSEYCQQATRDRGMGARQYMRMARDAGLSWSAPMAAKIAIKRLLNR